MSMREARGYVLVKEAEAGPVTVRGLSFTDHGFTKYSLRKRPWRNRGHVQKVPGLQSSAFAATFSVPYCSYCTYILLVLYVYIVRIVRRNVQRAVWRT